MTHIIQRLEYFISPSLLAQIHDGLQRIESKQVGWSYAIIFEKTQVALNFFRKTQSSEFESFFCGIQIELYEGLDSKFIDIMTHIFASNIYQYYQNVLRVPYRMRLLSDSFDEYKEVYKKNPKISRKQEIDELFEKYDKVCGFFLKIPTLEEFRLFKKDFQNLFEDCQIFISRIKNSAIDKHFYELFKDRHAIRSTKSAYELLRKYYKFLHYLSLMYAQPVFLKLFSDSLNVFRLIHQENSSFVLEKINQFILQQVCVSKNLEYLSLLLNNTQAFQFSSEHLVQIAELILLKYESIDKACMQSLIQNPNWDNTHIFCLFLSELNSLTKSETIIIPPKVKKIMLRHS